MKKIAVILSGCGYLDGSEIQEAVFTLFNLSKAGVEYHCFAPNDSQSLVKNHLTGEKVNESRNMLEEGARIARGKIRPLNELDTGEFNGVIFPGGYGAALNLSSFGLEGSRGSVHPEVKRVLSSFHEEKKPIGLICIAPNLAALILGEFAPDLTVGSDKGTADELEKCGVHHHECSVDEICVDKTNKIISTAAYMYEAEPHQVEAGISRLVQKVIELT